MKGAVPVALFASAVLLSGCSSDTAPPTVTQPPPPAPLSVTGISPTTGFSNHSVTIAGTGFSQAATVTMGGALATAVTVLGTSQIRATTPFGGQALVDVVITNPNGQSARLSQGFQFEFVTLAPSVTEVNRGARIDVTWTSSVARGANYDWIGFFAVGAANIEYDRFWWAYTEPGTSGTLMLNAPMNPGQYEFRYLLDDGYLDVARSGPIVVR